MEIKIGHLILLAVAIAVVYGIMKSSGMTAGLLGQWFITPAPTPTAPEHAAPQATEHAAPESAVKCASEGMPMPTSTLTVIDGLNPKQGISGLRVEVLEKDADPSDPYRTVLDYADTDSDGVATLTNSRGELLVGEEYKIVLRGDNTVYDRVVEKKMPCVSGDWANKVFSLGKVKTYYVGEFADMITPDNVIDCTDNPILNVTANTGIQQISFDINIGMPESAAGKALEDPVLVFRSPEGYELETGDILHIYATRKGGTDLGVPPSDLVGYLSGSTPIPLTTRTQDTYDGKTHSIMTAADSATYTIIVQYDADNINPADDKLEIVLDDLGDYNGKDVATRSVKAPAKKVIIQWCE